MFVLCVWAAEVSQANGAGAVPTMLHDSDSTQLQESMGAAGSDSMEDAPSEEQGSGPCKMTSWNGFGPCSESCGGGKRSWRRVVIQKPEGISKCAKLIKLTPCNLHPCGDEVEQDAYSKAWGDWTSARMSRVDDKRAQRDSIHAAQTARKLRKKVKKSYEKKLDDAKSKEMSAFSKATTAVKNGKSDISPLQRLEFKDFASKTEKVVEIREQRAKESEAKSKLLKVSPTATGTKRTAPVEVKPQHLPDATTFKHTAIYQNKIGDGDHVIARAKELTRKVSKQESLKQGKKQGKISQVKLSSQSGSTFKEHKWASHTKASSFKWYTAPKSSLDSGAVAFEQHHWDQATDHYKKAVRKIKNQQKDITRSARVEHGASFSLGDVQTDASKPTQADMAKAKTLIVTKLQAISERRIKLQSSLSTGVVPVQTEITNAVHRAYNKAYNVANKRADAAIKRIQQTAKDEVNNMKKQVETKMASEQKLLDSNIEKVHELEKESADVARVSNDKVKKMIDGRARLEEKQEISKVETNLAAMQAIKQSKSKLKKVTKEAFDEGIRAARIAKKNGNPTEQRLADDRANVLRDRVKTMRKQLKMTERLVATSPQSPNIGMKVTKMNAKQDLAAAEVNAQAMEERCEAAKVSVKHDCAGALSQQKANSTKSGFENTTPPEATSALSLLQLLSPKAEEKKEEKKLDGELKQLDKKINATENEKQEVRANLAKDKGCAAAKSKMKSACKEAIRSEKADHDAKIKAAGEVAVAAKYQAARVASLEAQGKATKAELTMADTRSTRLELKYRKMKNVPFKSKTEQAELKGKLKPGEETLVKKLVQQEVSVVLQNAQPNAAVLQNARPNVAPSSGIQKSKDAVKEAKVKQKEGKAMLQEDKDKTKLLSAKSKAKIEQKDSKKVIGEATSQLKQAKQQKNETKVQIAQENLISLKATRMKMDLMAKEKANELKVKTKGAAIATNKLKKEAKVEEKTASSKLDVKAAKLSAEKEEMVAAKLAAKSKHSAYKAAMGAARTASRVASGEGSREEVFAADGAAQAAATASKLAVESTQDIYQCNLGKVETKKLVLKLVKAKGAYKTHLTEQKQKLEKTTNRACAKADKLRKKNESAAKAAVKQKMEAKKAIAQEQDKLSKQAANGNPLIKQSWQIVKENGILTAVLPGKENATVLRSGTAFSVNATAVASNTNALRIA